MALAFLTTVLIYIGLLLEPANARIFEQVLFTWMEAGDFHVDFGFQIDPLSVVMMFVVTGVGFLIHVFSIGYMHEEYSYYRFFAYMNLFMFAMLNRGLQRTTMNTPAVTMVAAWIRAEIGVGPSIESGNHTCNGTCAGNTRTRLERDNAGLYFVIHWRDG